MDTMEITKIVGGVCGSLLAFLLIQTAADGLIVGGEGGHGDEHHFAYNIEVEEAGGATEEAVEEVPFAEVFASADATAGERLFRACASCHKLEDGANAVGPHLFGVVDRDIASVGGYSYSDALTGLDGAWTPEHMNDFLTSPSDYAPGTKMSYRGMGDAEDRANLIAYLQSIGG